jgi:hypothetical protein
LKEVLLCREDCVDETITIAAQIDENGRLLILGNACYEEDEREYWYVIDSENTKKLSSLLCHKKNTPFLEVLWQKYSGCDSCDRMMAFCREHGISYHYLELE